MASVDPGRFPVEFADAARRYLLSEDGPDDRERDLLQAFGPLRIGTVSHRRAVCLGLNAIRRVLDRWGMPDRGPTADLRAAVERVGTWIEGAEEPEPSAWEVFCHLGAIPHEAGPRTGEGYYAAAVFKAVSALAKFALFAGIWDGVEVLVSSSLVDGEEARAARGEIGFDEWLTGFALPAAQELRRLPPDELNPHRRTTPRSEE